MALFRYHYSHLMTLPALKAPWQRAKVPVEQLGIDALVAVAKGFRASEPPWLASAEVSRTWMDSACW